ncbi:hypothetical protein C8J27_103146 [Rhodobacter aestuarii]|uniref:Uncharacterized protein n=1 Tax=Rhodobacter aestuarii TaxID=453582 RepID=A0A1N7K8D7_9RHOB|nr:hypothetical protein [Rhodobacter aestuarii]PTV95818.1 hypothetical protein C8J27_103146 [Rhodobacter aestuarii]SIS57714.1 hypothetical protein SAMN05421580_102288 [Rhodobacter aestuarii]
MQEITACQEICRDFSWLGAIPTILEGIVDVAPAAAIVWASWSYFNKVRLDRDADLRRLRQEVYGKYLFEVAEAEKEMFKVGGFDPAKPAMRFHEELTLIAPKPVLDASKEFIRTVFFIGLDFGMKKRAEGAELAELIEKEKASRATYATAHQKLLTAMRQDLLAGSSIPVALGDEE